MVLLWPFAWSHMNKSDIEKLILVIITNSSVKIVFINEVLSNELQKTWLT